MNVQSGQTKAPTLADIQAKLEQISMWDHGAENHRKIAEVIGMVKAAQEPVEGDLPPEPIENLDMWAWTIIANVDGGNGLGAGGVEHSHQTEEWRRAACEWRDAFHRTLRGGAKDTHDERVDLEKVQWSAFTEHLAMIREHLADDVPSGELDQLAELGKRVETMAMARVVRWLRDTTLATARRTHPLNPVLDAFDRDAVNLLRALES